MLSINSVSFKPQKPQKSYVSAPLIQKTPSPTVSKNIETQNPAVSASLALVNFTGVAQLAPKFSDVEVNGLTLKLADIAQNASQKFKIAIRSESIKRIFGFGNAVRNIPDNPFIRIVTAELKPFTAVGGLSTIPKELAEELPKILNHHNNPTFVMDTPMYTGRVGYADSHHIFWELIQDEKTKQYFYQKFAGDKLVQQIPVQEIDSMNVKIFGEESEKVRIFRAEIDGSRVPLGWIQKSFSPEKLSEIQEAIAKSTTDGVLLEKDNYKIIRTEGQEYFVPKLKYNLWHNRKFRLNPPKDEISNIYWFRKDKPYDLTEKFLYFNKFIYEHTVKLKKTKSGTLIQGEKAVLGADGFILNDWHTGPLVAMLRLNPIAQNAFGRLKSSIAGKIQNLPIISLVHNAGYHGNSDKHQAKYLNIMFGDLAAKIVANAYIPSLSSIEGDHPFYLKHSLFTGHNFNPMSMLLNYSDSVHPVSINYGKEISKDKYFGVAHTYIYKLRAKAKAQSEENIPKYVGNIRAYAKRLGIDMNNVSIEQITRPTLRGRDNGLNKVNNILTQAMIQKHSGLSENEAEKYNIAALRPYKEGLSPQEALDWKQHNKQIVLKYYIDAIEEAKKANVREKSGPLNAWLCHEDKDYGQMTDLTGVNVNTPVFATAGRIDAQKGNELYLNSIIHYAKEHHNDGSEVPVFIIQGQVQDDYARSIVDLTEKVKKQLINMGYRKFADRILFLDRGENFKYTMTKIFTDHLCMPSMFEPCGLVHKEFMNLSGAIALCNKIGGIMAKLIDDINCFAVTFNPHPRRVKIRGREKAFDYPLNVKRFAQGIHRACKVHLNVEKYGQMIRDALESDFTWAKEGGPAYEYAQDLAKVGLIPEI